MRTHFPATLGAALMIVSAVAMAAQDQTKAAAPEQTKATTTVELTGCVSLSPSSSGQFAFVEATSGGTYRLNGKGLKKYAGQRVRLVGDPSSKRVRIRMGLWPSPNVAAQAGALDPAQESIARHSAGTSGMPENAPELRVVRVHGVEGACQ
jgi:hypothetical protein